MVTSNTILIILKIISTLFFHLLLLWTFASISEKGNFSFISTNFISSQKILFSASANSKSQSFHLYKTIFLYFLSCKIFSIFDKSSFSEIFSKFRTSYFLNNFYSLFS